VFALVGRLARRIARLMRRSEHERRMDEEMAFHLEMEATDIQRAGLSEAEARRRARLTFGGVERFREEGRDARGSRLVEHAVRDIRHGWRTMFARVGTATRPSAARSTSMPA
jgi:hypothetical protein